MAKNTVFVALSVVVIIILLAFLLYAINSKAFTANTASKSEKFYDEMMVGAEDFYANGTQMGPYSAGAVPPQIPTDLSPAGVSKYTPTGLGSGAPGILGNDPNGNEIYNPVVANGGADAAAAGAGCFPRDRLTADELLPKDAANSKWAQMNPVGQGSIGDQNFLTAGWHVGLMSPVKRNANQQIRSEPIAPVIQNISPWNVASYGPEDSLLRRPFELNQGDY